MPTAAQHLQTLGVTVAQARDYIFANYELHLADILSICDQYAVTNAMLAEIVGGVTAGEVVGYFASRGLDSTILDGEPPGDGYDYGYALPRLVGVDEGAGTPLL